MRFAVFVFSALLVFATTYAHAIVWLPAVSGAVVRTAAGHYIKVASKKALAGSLFVAAGYGTNFAVNYCKKNKEKCKDILGDTVEYFFDDDADNSDDEQYQCQVPNYTGTPSKTAKWYCDNYKGGYTSHKMSGSRLQAVCQRETVNIHCTKTCQNRVFYRGTNTGEKSSLQAAATAEANYYIDYHNANYSSRATFVGIDDDYDVWSNNVKSLDNDIQRALKQQNRSGIVFNRILQGRYIQNTTHSDGRSHQNKGYFGIQVIVKANCDEANQTMSDNKKEQQIQKIVQNLSDDDIDYIINNYSKEIEINIDKYCATAGACAELDQAFGDEVMNNKGKYDIDRINKDNCELKNDKIISCDNAKIDKDDNNTDTTPKDPKKPDDDDNSTKPKDDDDEPVICDTSDITREICKYLDWVNDEAEEPTDTKVDVEEPEDKKPDDDLIDVMKSCPADIEFSVSMLGHTMNFEISTMPFCLVSKQVRPYIISAGTLSAIFILAGVRRD